VTQRTSTTLELWFARLCCRCVRLHQRVVVRGPCRRCRSCQGGPATSRRRGVVVMCRPDVMCCIGTHASTTGMHNNLVNVVMVWIVLSLFLQVHKRNDFTPTLKAW
jgi:hypothetical protein